MLSYWGVLVLCQPLLSKAVDERKDGNVLMRILRNPEAADFDESKTIGFSEAIVLGVALSINNIAGGFDAGVTNLNLWMTAIISGFFSFLCVRLCSYIGKKYLALYLGKWATVIAGTLLIIIAVNQVL